MARVLIVYYSRSGHTEEMARHIADGVRQGGVADVEVRDVERTKVDDLLAPDGIIMGSPTYYGGMASELKRLLDESVSIHGRLDGRAEGVLGRADGRAHSSQARRAGHCLGQRPQLRSAPGRRDTAARGDAI